MTEVRNELISRENEDLAGQNEFLKSLVARLETELRSYQSKYPRVVEDQADRDDVFRDSAPPWTTVPEYMSSLLQAYDDRISELRRENSEHLKSLGEVRESAETLKAHNTELQDELEHKIKKLLSRFENGKEPGGVLTGDEEVRELITRAELLSEQNEIMREQQVSLQKRIQDAQIEIKEKDNVSDNLRETRSQLKDISEDHRRICEEFAEASDNLDSLRSQRNELSEQLKSTREELGAVGAELNECQNMRSEEMAGANSEISSLRSELQNMIEHSEENVEKMSNVQKSLDCATEREHVITAELDSYKSDLERALKSLRNSEKLSADLKERERDALRRVRQAREELCERALQCDQARAREQQCAKVIARLEERLTTEVADTKRSSDEEINKANSSFKSREESILAEIRRLQSLLSGALVNKDGAERESRSLERKLRAIVDSSNKEQERLNDELNIFRVAVKEAESQRDLADERSDRMRTELSKHRDEWQRERKVCELQVIELQKLQDAKDLQVAETQDQMHSMEQKIQKVSGKLEASRASYDKLKSKARAELDRWKSEKAREVRALESRVQEAYTMHEEAEARANELIQSQSAMSTKWNEESRSSLLHFQRVIRDLKEEIARVSARNVTVEERIGTLIRERDEAMGFQEKHAQANSEFQTTIAESERRLQETTKTLKEFADRESKILQENRSLETAVDRKQIDLNKLKRQMDIAVRRERALQQQNELLRGAGARFLTVEGGADRAEMPTKMAASVERRKLSQSSASESEDQAQSELSDVSEIHELAKHKSFVKLKTIRRGQRSEVPKLRL
eukprot:941652_1